MSFFTGEKNSMTNQLASLEQRDYFYLDPFWSVNLGTYIIIYAYDIPHKDACMSLFFSFSFFFFFFFCFYTCYLNTFIATFFSTFISY